MNEPISPRARTGARRWDPALRRPSLRPDRLTAELRRRLAEVDRTVLEVVRHPHPSPESLHHLHREMRRFRLGLLLWERLLSARDREALRTLTQRVKRLTRLAGQVRDRDVVLALLEKVKTVRGAPEETRRFQRFLARLRDDGRTGRELLRAFLRSEQDAHLFEELRSALDRPARVSAATELRHIVSDVTDERHRKVRQAHRRARRRPTPDRLHRLRIRVRQFRQLSELTARLVPRHGPPLPRGLRQLQDRLGHIHDLDVALASLDADLVRSPWASALRRNRRRARKLARTGLADLPTRLPTLAPARTPVGRPARAPRRSPRR